MLNSNNICLHPELPVITQNESPIDQVVRSYLVPGKTDKNIVLQKILKKIEEGRQNQVSTKAILLSPVYRIAISTAASLVLVFLLHFFFSLKVFEGNIQQVNAIRLPDHSRVVLSENSAVSYPRYWWKREIKLQGEAYFEVKKGDKFIVRTPKGDVRVLGTRFQVSDTSNGLKVTCFEGKVMFTTKNLAQEISAGNSMIYQPDGQTSMVHTDEMYPGTATFRKTFSNETLSNVVADLENFFQVRILLNQSVQKHFSGKLETTSAETAIKILCRSLNLEYSFQTNEVIIVNEKK